MSLPRADALSPIDAATLWPQLHRLKTEVIATRVGENMLLGAGLAATGLGHLPRLPRTLVLGIRRGLRYRGVLVARELAGDDRDAALIERLREIYAGQGIEVSDEILKEGVKALSEERFVYRPKGAGSRLEISMTWPRPPRCLPGPPESAR